MLLLGWGCQTLGGLASRAPGRPDLTPTATAAPTGPAPATPSPATAPAVAGHIAYLGRDGNLYTVDQAGVARHAITRDAGEHPDQTITYSQPTWSPAGDRLAYVRQARNKVGDLIQAGVYSTAADGTDIAEAFSSRSDTPFYLYWSPGGESIAFLSSGSSTSSLTLRLAPVRGGEARAIATGSPFYWAWAPDGHALLAHIGGDRRLNRDARLTRYPVASRAIPLDLPYRPTTFQAPAWSPNGQQVLFAAASVTGDGLFLADENGDRLQLLAPYEGAIAFAWSPHSDRVAYITTADPGPVALGPLYVVDAQAGAEPRRITEGPVVALYWAADGQHLAYLRVGDSLAGDKQASGRRAELRFSLDVADMESGRRVTVAVFQPTEDYLRSVLPFFDQYIRSTTPWSPDSRSLVYAADDDAGGSSIYVADITGGEPRRIADGVLAFWSFR